MLCCMCVIVVDSDMHSHEQFLQLTASLNPIYMIQLFVQSVVQPVGPTGKYLQLCVHNAAGCQTGCVMYKDIFQLSAGCMNSSYLIHETQHPTVHIMYTPLQLVVQPAVSCKHSYNPLSNRLDECLHDAAGSTMVVQLVVSCICSFRFTLCQTLWINRNILLSQVHNLEARTTKSASHRLQCFDTVGMQISSDEVRTWLSIICEVQMSCLWCSWCHCHTIISCFITIQHRQVILEKMPLNQWHSQNFPLGGLQYTLANFVIFALNTTGISRHILTPYSSWWWCAFSALTLLVGQQEEHPARKKLSDGVLARLSVWDKMQICIWSSWCHCHPSSLAYPGCPGKKAVKHMCACVC